jgi:tetratricopeptide (TPR) repeat protein
LSLLISLACGAFMSPAIGPLLAQRTKPVYDPETKDGLLIEHIQQESDPVEKVRYMEQFATQYPSHTAVAWVYDQLQPAYYQYKEWDEAMRIGAARLAIEPENLEAAKIALRSADAKHDSADIIKWSDRVWQVATAVGAKGGPLAAEAKQTKDYAEFCVYSTAMAATDPKTKLALLQHLEKQMPSSKYVAGLTDEYFRIYRQLGDEEKSIETAENGLKIEPANVDMLIFVAEVQFRKNDPKARQVVLEYIKRTLEALDKTAKPEGMTEEEWTKKKRDMSGMANYMGGMSYSLNNNFRAADTMLRAALPYVQDNQGQEAALLYHLGMANYRLAEAGGERSRPVDALKFMRRCAAIKSPFQEQALRNVESIKSEYSLP